MLINNYSRATIYPNWHLAWGKVSQLAQCTWNDEKLAIFSQISHGVYLYAISPSERFVVVGDIWLSNRQTLLKLQDLPEDHFLSDLELVAKVWEDWGLDTFNKLVGIFALAIWDREKQKLWLGRDSMGGKNLYYTKNGSTRWIAPNLRSLAPHHNRALDLVALRDYLCCAFVPGARTLWQDVGELQPGSILCFPEQKIHTYWQLPKYLTAENAQNQPSIDSYSTQLRNRLTEVVQEYLPPQKPVGVFLSGGLDSSSITALASQLHSAPVHTFSIHFGKHCPNELEYSSLVANHCGTNHHILEITFRQMWERLPQTMECLDNPIGDPLTVPNLLLGQLAREFVEVVLNGEGGDPCFGGPKNQPMLLNQLYSTVKEQDSLQAYLLSFKKCAGDLSQLLKPAIWEQVCNQPYVFSEDLNSTNNYLNRLMALNIKFKGADHILTKVNNLTTAVNLQGRSPLFDQRIVELSMEIPPEYKLMGAQEKAVLKQAVADLLPEQILLRPKSGMMVPVQLGFKKYWQRKARKLLLNRQAEIATYLNQEVIKEWLNYQGDPWGRYGIKLWLITSLEIWLQVNKKVGN